ncbi:hypothetical protein CHLNCDRAFT_57448 [Chlorella variabilis]|uniref:Branched-chain-amino-acid aminotransferase n=1 Tax=Chlorella variabilis TaxID=554065 RepID=E1ZAS5_CHLVA|nr:hypothetical protein CHLNCDRAFT_57448 [Chlorella variabilis]EFN57110.1 hypothetical protein CHLNCDRAFT_57448 [Chlorella variabilis]|eukprot:XP_005849212.1 hypothetical protein CHLNCDRAFT_57448 [Chlorella variabilis]
MLRPALFSAAALGRSLLSSSSALGTCAALTAAVPRWFSAQPSPEEGDRTADAQYTFRARDLLIERSPVQQPPINLEDLKFGTVFTDHMFHVEHVVGQGWGRPAVKPFGLLQVHPAAQVLHYGLCCFEGMKAYAGVDGRTRLFRPELNMARLRRSARRLQLADFDPQELLACLKQLLMVDRSWLPEREGYSIYVRPFIFSSASALGVAKPARSTISILLSPVGPYFPTGLKPISLFVDELNRRAWPGGVGDCKVGGNYAPTIQPQVEAAQRYGTSQVLYTFRESHEHPDHGEFEECGAMNMFFYMEQRDGRRVLATPALTGTILPGVTRDSVLQLASGWGECEVQERPITIAEVRQASEEGRLLEIFGSGTACIVQPVGSLIRANGEVYRTRFSPDDDPAGSLSSRLQRALLDIQYGRVEHPWGVALD